MSKENPFKQVGGPLEEAPKDIRQRVMDGIEGIRLVKDLTTLFTNNFGAALLSFSGGKRARKKNK